MLNPRALVAFHNVIIITNNKTPVLNPRALLPIRMCCYSSLQQFGQRTDHKGGQAGWRETESVQRGQLYWGWGPTQPESIGGKEVLGGMAFHQMRIQVKGGKKMCWQLSIWIWHKN